MKVLYVSVLASPSVIKDARSINPSYCGYAVQKFNSLVVRGLLCNDAQVTALSIFHIPTQRIWHHKRETVDGIDFRYVSSLNWGPLRFVWVFFYCFFYVLIWGVVNKKNKVLVCDVLNASASGGSVLASWLIGLKRVGIMTDMPGLLVNMPNCTALRYRLYAKMCMSCMKAYTHFVFLTKQMNDVINVKKRPYIVMEGLVDTQIDTSERIAGNVDKRIILYAGGLHERYGLKMLVEAFMQLEFLDVELWLYGKGPFAKLLPEYEKKDSRIRYWGIQPNTVIVEAEKTATLLVNPRPTHEEFAQYSFPSKNMEYMLSGTPLLTTKLPGMPSEYNSHVFLFEEESVQGFFTKLEELLSLPSQQLKDKGLDGRNFVLNNKNYSKQCARIMNLIRC